MMTPRRRRILRCTAFGAVLVALLSGLYSCMISMPGKSHQGPLPPLTASESSLASAIRRDVVELAETIGERNVVKYAALKRAADYVESGLRVVGPVRRHTYKASERDCDNLEAEIRGTSAPGEIVVIGAHYDSVVNCPGANDNASGAAGLLALARSLANAKPARTLRFVAFVNEEPPHFRTNEMGSRVYARRCRERNETVTAMLSLETIGCFTDAPNTQKYPAPLGLCYPSTGNFIAFVGNVSSRSLVRRCVKTFRAGAAFPSEGAALPGWLPGVGWSDHESFWENGFPAVMVTDTAPFRFPQYHLRGDTPEKIDFERCARVVAGVEQVVRDLAAIP
jgi:Zn-dependent M28 family amino/carboxypeptidase